MLKEEKPKIVDEIREAVGSSRVICVLNMHKMPGRSMQQIRRSIDAKIRMTRKSLMLRALGDAGEAARLAEYMEGSPALLFSDKNPFRLYAAIKDARMPAAAKPGDTAMKDITIPKGATPLAPGPAISQLQKVGLKTSVQQGKIHVMQDKVVVKKGELISSDVANVLGALKIEPMEIGLDLVAAYEDGVIYTREVLDVDRESYLSMVLNAVAAAVELALGAGFVTQETAPLALSRAFAEARSLCVEARIFDAAFIGDVLAKASAEGTAVEKLIS